MFDKSRECVLRYDLIILANEYKDQINDTILQKDMNYMEKISCLFYRLKKPENSKLLVKNLEIMAGKFAKHSVYYALNCYYQN